MSGKLKLLSTEFGELNTVAIGDSPPINGVFATFGIYPDIFLDDTVFDLYFWLDLDAKERVCASKDYDATGGCKPKRLAPTSCGRVR